MSGVPNIEIAESIKELKSEMKKQKTALNFAKVQAIYLLRIQAVETVRYLAVMQGNRIKILSQNMPELDRIWSRKLLFKPA